MKLTRSELEIMDALWDAGKPMSRADLLAYTNDKTWKDSSVHILLNGLLKKEAIVETGFVKRNKTYGRVFAPACSREAYYAQAVFSNRRKPNVQGLFRELLSREEVTAEDLDAVSAMIAEKKG